mgnify:CR=1 FL=1
MSLKLISKNASDGYNRVNLYCIAVQVVYHLHMKAVYVVKKVLVIYNPAHITNNSILHILGNYYIQNTVITSNVLFIIGLQLLLFSSNHSFEHWPTYSLASL